VRWVELRDHNFDITAVVAEGSSMIQRPRRNGL
jgi:hypothetical protein